MSIIFNGRRFLSTTTNLRTWKKSREWMSNMLTTTKTKSFNSRYSYIWRNADLQVIDKAQPAPKPRPVKATKSLKGDLMNEEFTGFAEVSKDEAKDVEGSVDENPFENLDTIQKDIDLPEWSKMRLSD